MPDLLDSSLLADVLAARRRIDATLVDLVGARRTLWRAALDAGLIGPAQRFADRAIGPEAVVERIIGRTDPAAGHVTSAYEDLRAAEEAASAANDELAGAMGRLRASLPRGERRAELGERLMGRPGRRIHRVHALEEPRGHVRLASRSVCRRRVGPLWRLADRRPIDIELCEACREGRAAFPGERDEVPTGLPAASGVRRLAGGLEAVIVRVAWRGLPVVAIAGCVLVAGALLDLGPIASNPLGEFVVGQLGRVIGTR